MIINFISGTSFLPDLEIKESVHSIPLDRIGVLILAGGEGKRLDPLTKSRCKPALQFGGRYALIDVPLSQAISSGLQKIYVIGQYLSFSLHKHLVETYAHHPYPIHYFGPEEREGNRIWFEGTADSVRQNRRYIEEMDVDYLLILSGDQLYNIDFHEMIHFAAKTEASMVVAAQPVMAREAKRMGLLKIEKGGTRLVDFHEKPQDDTILQEYFTDDATLSKMGFDSGKHYLASMGIYLFKKKALMQLVQEDNRADFGKHLIATEMKKKSAHVFLYGGYWEDIGTIESYFQSNLALTREEDDRKGGFQCYDEKHPLFSKPTFLPGAKIRGGKIVNSIISAGSIIDAEEIVHSILGVRSVVHKGSKLRDVILLGSENYAQKSPLRHSQDEPSIGERCLIEKAIIDENVHIGKGVELTNRGQHTHLDGPHGIYVREGIIVVAKGSHIPDNFIF